MRNRVLRSYIGPESYRICFPLTLLTGRRLSAGEAASPPTHRTAIHCRSTVPPHPLGLFPSLAMTTTTHPTTPTPNLDAATTARRRGGAPTTTSRCPPLRRTPPPPSGNAMAPPPPSTVAGATHGRGKPGRHARVTITPPHDRSWHGEEFLILYLLQW
jgi:hypothetical protein